MSQTCAGSAFDLIAASTATQKCRAQAYPFTACEVVSVSVQVCHSQLLANSKHECNKHGCLPSFSSRAAFSSPTLHCVTMPRTMHESRHARCVARELTKSRSTMFAKSWHSNNEGLPYISILNTCEARAQKTRRASHLWSCNTGSTLTCMV